MGFLTYLIVGLDQKPMLLEFLVKNFNKMGDSLLTHTMIAIGRFSGRGTADDVSFFVGWNLKLIEYYIIFSIKIRVKNIFKKYTLSPLTFIISTSKIRSCQVVLLQVH